MMSPGYRIEIERQNGNITAFHNQDVLVKSDQVAILHETRLPDCYYFPIEAVEPGILEPSEFRTFCPFKGTASYWHVNTPDGLIENGAWSYLTPLTESAGLEGRLSFTSAVAGRYESQFPPQKKELSDGHINSPLSDWILREAGYYQTRRELVQAIGRKFVEAGIAVYRMNVTIWSLHPQIAGVNFLWNRDSDEVSASGASYEVFEMPEYINSPLNLVTKGLGGVRQPLNTQETEFQFPIMEELKKEGATDYVAMPLRFSDGQFHSLTLACDHENGFTIANLGLIFECVGVISKYLEVLTLRNNTTTLLDTYLGKRTGEKVLNGDIRRGKGEDIQAVILFSDLRNSTKLAEEMPRNEYLNLLNRYFETVLGPIGENGGEVLKFIGDAVLAIFQISGGNDKVIQAENALSSAQSVINAINNTGNNVDDKDENKSERPIDIGISLHVGEVTYGNVGGENRLDFTVIGPAVNLASKLEGLCKTTGNQILLSRDFKQTVERSSKDISQFVSLGEFNLAGISSAQEVYSLG
jgi:adenylate cyclase